MAGGVILLIFLLIIAAFALAVPTALGRVAGLTGRIPVAGALVTSALVSLELYCFRHYSGPTPELPEGVSQSAEGMYLDPLLFHYPLLAATLTLGACVSMLVRRHGIQVVGGMVAALASLVLAWICGLSPGPQAGLVAWAAFLGVYQALGRRGMPVLFVLAGALLALPHGGLMMTLLMMVVAVAVSAGRRLWGGRVDSPTVIERLPSP